MYALKLHNIIYIRIYVIPVLPQVLYSYMCKIKGNTTPSTQKKVHCSCKFSRLDHLKVFCE